MRPFSNLEPCLPIGRKWTVIMPALLRSRAFACTTRVRLIEADGDGAGRRVLPSKNYRLNGGLV